jgi:crotonobetainyl-CoA:carnitine CoA-transferase CaiB-like acyl-CoA transferase
VSGVLDGLRVLDFGRYIAGPFCAALLGDLGAEVIRIERIGGGEDRGLIPVGANPDGGGAMFLAMNRNKLGMTLDPASPKGREITRKLIATADVVVANLPPAVLRSLALDLDSLREVKPDIILTTVTGFGAGGPLSHKHGFDGIGQTMSGAVYLSGTPELPTITKVPWVDFGTAFLSAFRHAGGTDRARQDRPRPEGRGGVAAHRDRDQQRDADRAVLDRGSTAPRSRTAASTRRQPTSSAPGTGGSSQP